MNRSGRLKIFVVVISIVAAVILAAIVFGAFFLWRSGNDIDGQRLLEDYFEENTGYTFHEEQYQECYRYAINDMVRQLSGKMVYLLESAGLSADGVDTDEIAELAGDKISGYFSRSDNQITLVDAVLSRSSAKVGKIKRNGDTATAEVTVTSVDITDVNRMLIDDSVSVQKFAVLAAQLVLERTPGVGVEWIKNLIKGDLSFVLDGFVENAKKTKCEKSYVGQVEFQYHKDTGEWSICSKDEGLLKAYYGMD